MASALANGRGLWVARGRQWRVARSGTRAHRNFHGGRAFAEIVRVGDRVDQTDRRTATDIERAVAANSLRATRRDRDIGGADVTASGPRVQGTVLTDSDTCGIQEERSG